MAAPVKKSYSTSFVTEKRKRRRKGKKVHRKKKHSKKHHDMDRLASCTVQFIHALFRSSKREKRSITELFDVGPEKRKVKHVQSMPSLYTAEGSAVNQGMKMFKNILKIAKDKPVDSMNLDFMMGRIEKVGGLL